MRKYAYPFYVIVHVVMSDSEPGTMKEVGLANEASIICCYCLSRYMTGEAVWSHCM